MAEPAASPEGGMSDDEQEAKSSRYASTVKLVRLSSGNLAVFWQDSMEVLFPGPGALSRLLEILGEDEVAWEEARARLRRGSVSLASTKTLEEMDL